MTPSFLAKPSITSSLLILLSSLQLSACGSEVLSAISPSIGSGTDIVADHTGLAKISGVNTGSVIEDMDPDGDNLLEVAGKLSISDSDEGEAAFIANKVGGDYGALEIKSSGDWRYTADNSQPVIQNLTSNATLTDNLSVSSIDGTTEIVAITIIGVIDAADNTNSSAIISGNDTGSVIEDVDPDNNNLLETNGKLNISDNDSGEAAFIATTFNGDYGKLTINATGNWSYAANNNQSSIQDLVAGATLSDSLMISSLDGTAHTIEIIIYGADEANSPAVISGGDNNSVTEDTDPDNDNLLEISGKLNISDTDPGEAAFMATTFNGNYGDLTINALGNWNYAANNNQAVIQDLAAGSTIHDHITVSSLDGTSYKFIITIIGVDEIGVPRDIGISWIAPAAREDNSAIALSEIASYKIYYGSAQGQYPNSITINDGSAVSYTFQNLTAGTYYFVLTTIDSAGRESQYSAEVSYAI